MLDDYTGWVSRYEGWQRVAGTGEVTFFADHLSSEDALADRLAGFDVVVIERERTPFPETLLRRLPRLRLLASTGPVNWSIDLAAAERLGITVTCTSSSYDETPELTWALILSLVRRVTAEEHALRQGAWQTEIGHRLAGKTLGILGLGHVGRRVAEFGRCFGMDVVAWSHNLTQERAAGSQVKRVEFDELLATSDVLTVHVVLSERTRNLIGHSELLRMKRSAYLVNTSRSPIVDHAALADALTAGTIAGAALDVFPQEPLPPNHLLRTAPNLLMTPHIGYVTAEQYEIFYSEVVDNIVQFVAGSPVRRLVMTEQ